MLIFFICVSLSETNLEDSHLHVWGDGKGSFPYAEGQEPPDRLRASSSPDVLIQEMDKAGVGGALIVQVSSITEAHIIGTWNSNTTRAFPFIDNA